MLDSSSFLTAIGDFCITENECPSPFSLLSIGDGRGEAFSCQGEGFHGFFCSWVFLNFHHSCLETPLQLVIQAGQEPSWEAGCLLSGVGSWEGQQA